MAGLGNAIPLDLGADEGSVGFGVAPPFAAVAGLRGRAQGVAPGRGNQAATAMGQLGLLAAPRPLADGDRRIEDWIASQLDLSLASEARPAARTVWDRLIDRLPVACRPGGRATAASRAGAETAFADWSRFRIAYRRGITVVRLIDHALVKERHVRELTRDLLELIEAGNHRLVVSFHGIERAASWLALAVDEAYRRARAADGGELKVCGLSPALATILGLAGMAPGIELYPDEDAALGARWPEPATPRTLPVDILMALMSGPEIPPVSGGRRTPRRPRSRRPIAGTARAASPTGRARRRTSRASGWSCAWEGPRVVRCR